MENADIENRQISTSVNRKAYDRYTFFSPA